MFASAVFCLFFSVVINFYSVSSDHWILSRSSVQPRIINNVSAISNETDFSDEELLENNMTSTTENDPLFWTKPATKDIVEADPEVESESDKLDNEQENINTTLQPLADSSELEINASMELAINESSEPALNATTEMEISASTEMEINATTPVSVSSTEVMQDDPEPGKNQSNNVTHNDTVPAIMDEKIILQRNNCHLEIAIQESYDLKIEIRFGKLQHDTSGKCCITLNGQEGTLLGVLISNIYLHQNGSHGEVLKVVTADHGSDFVLKEYYSGTSYQPLLLTEAQRVYILLYYKVGSVSPNEQDSHFNLEVFSYHKYGNHIHHGSSYPADSYFPYQNGIQNLPVEEHYFAPYYYY